MLLRAAQPARSRARPRRGAGRSARAGRRTCASRRCSPAISAGSPAGRRSAVQVGHDPLRLARRRRRSRARATRARSRFSRQRCGAAGPARRSDGERRPARRPAAGGAAVERLEPHQRRLGGDVDVRARQHLADAAVERRGQRGLHLHALDDRDDVAGLDLVARRRPGSRRRRPARGCARGRRRRATMRCGTPSTSTSRSAPCTRGQRAVRAPRDLQPALVAGRRAGRGPRRTRRRPSRGGGPGRPG